MKKVSIIAVGVIFIVSVIAVGFLGMAMHVYNPIAYVTSIEWINTTEVLDNLAASIPGITKYDESKDTADNTAYPLKHRNIDKFPNLSKDDIIYAKGCDLEGDKKINLNFKCVGLPASATDTTLKYYVSEDAEKRYTFSEGENNTFNLIIDEPCQVNIRISSTDGENVTYNIKLMVM